MEEKAIRFEKWIIYNLNDLCSLFLAFFINCIFKNRLRDNFRQDSKKTSPGWFSVQFSLQNPHFQNPLRNWYHNLKHNQQLSQNLNTFCTVFKLQIFFVVHHFPPADYITHIITKRLFRV